MSNVWIKIKPPLGAKINWSHPLSNGIVGCWLLNEGGGNRVFDLSNNNCYGRITTSDSVGTSSDWRTGPFGRTLHFYPSCIQIDNKSNLASLKKFTLSLWFKCDDSSVNGTGLMGSWNATGYMLWISNSPAGAIGMPIDGSPYVTGTTDVRDGKSYHCVGTYDGTTSKIYVNGVLEKQQNESPPTTYSAEPFKIGQYRDLATLSRGYIDIPIVYNRALTQNEIIQLYKHPFCIFNY